MTVKSAKTPKRTKKTTATKPAFEDKAIERLFDQFPGRSKSRLLQLRQLIFDVAAKTDGVGEVTEALRWGEPAYLTQSTKSGSSVRLGIPKSERQSDQPAKIGVYFQCQTTLVGGFRRRHGDSLNFEGNRAIILDMNRALPIKRIADCIEDALTYHLQKRRKVRSKKRAKKT